MTQTKVRIDGNESSPALVLAHGAGASSDSAFMESLTRNLVQEEVCVYRFDFEYMLWAREHGRKRPPPRLPALIEEYVRVLDIVDRPCFVAGKSMGGRVASHMLLESGLENVLGGLAFGFPFHPVGKQDKLRTDHFQNLCKKLLIVQGERDAFGNQALVQSLKLESTVQVAWCPGGDHDLNPLKRSGITQAQNMSLAAQRAATFMRIIQP
ncbi:MAG: alpha/beta hydrolase [Oceanospirillaceae bacterium]|nr:alpha/beta hydrolase [Oceanospirillaceae bacterium]